MATVYNQGPKGNDLATLKVASATIDITGGDNPLGARAADDVIYTGLRVPHGALVTEVSWFVTTACTGAGGSAGTWKLGFSGDSGNDNVQAATAMSTCGTAGMHYSLIFADGYDGNDGATDTAAEKIALRNAQVYHADAAGEEIILTLATNTWTAGKVTFYAKYYATGDLA